MVIFPATFITRIFQDDSVFPSFLLHLLIGIFLLPHFFFLTVYISKESFTFILFCGL